MTHSVSPTAVPTADRVLQVLAVLAQQGKALSAAELMEHTGLARSTLYRQLARLKRWGFVLESDGYYAPGPLGLQLALGFDLASHLVRQARPAMVELAQQSQGGKYVLPSAHVSGAELDMSFSGLKTAVVNLAHNAQQKGEPLDAPALARDFARAVSGELVPRAMRALELTGRTVLVAAGGVAANSVIRADLQAACDKAGVKLYLPPLKWCGDNGTMIGAQGYYEYLAGHTASTTLNAYATMDLGDPVY